MHESEDPSRDQIITREAGNVGLRWILVGLSLVWLIIFLKSLVVLGEDGNFEYVSDKEGMCWEEELSAWLMVSWSFGCEGMLMDL